jgi:alcohol dehydrogenase (cytochrome c)
MTALRKTAVCLFLLTPPLAAQRTFATHCTICHGGDANGTDRAPGIIPFVTSHSDDEIAVLVHNGRPDRGMPRFDFNDAEMKALTGHLRGLASGAISAAAGPARGGRGGAPFQPHPASLKLQDGRTLDGTLTSSTQFSATLLTADGRFHLLTRSGETYTERRLEPKRDWPSYDGSDSGNRYSSLEEINTTNVKRLAPAWIFPVPGAPRLEVTPVVVDGIMYITGPNEAYALDATTGRQIWSFRTPRTHGLLSEAGGGANRGVAISGDRVFMVTDNAHLLALDRRNGHKLWDTTMGDTKEGYSATAAPLVIGDLVLSGIAGGEEGARGFVDAYRAATGERVWRFWTIPARGEKGAETWIGNALEHGCGATWVTGSYDATLGLTYWTVGNPCPDFNGDERKGDNLYTSSVVALDAKTGTLKWHYQFTPHDTHDWDSTAPLILIDEPWEGRPRKLLAHADPNGFFFVLDRTDGKLLLASPLGPQNWTTGYGKDGRPVLTEHFESTLEGTVTCHAGAMKWASASFDPVSKLFAARVSEGCSTIRKDPTPPEMGQRFFGGNGFGGGGAGNSYIRAVDLRTGAKVWDYPVPNGGGSGTLATAGGLVFFGESGGTFTAVNLKTGSPVWHFESGQNWRASPMTYMAGGKQYVVLAGDGGILSFALVQ